MELKSDKYIFFMKILFWFAYLMFSTFPINCQMCPEHTICIRFIKEQKKMTSKFYFQFKSMKILQFASKTLKFTHRRDNFTIFFVYE